MLPQYWPSLFFKISAGAVLTGLCLYSFGQTDPLTTPKTVDYPGIIQTFEKLIQIDSDKIRKRTDHLIKNGKILGTSNSSSDFQIEPDFLNSLLLHSTTGHIRLASNDRCRFYEALITDLLKSSEGKTKNILISYIEKNNRQATLISKQDFLSKIIQKECPETVKNIEKFQIKTLPETIKTINFYQPNNLSECRILHQKWLTNPQAPFLCQIHEYLKEATSLRSNPNSSKSQIALADFLNTKLNVSQKEYLQNLCENLDNEDGFCSELLNTSFWKKISKKSNDLIYAEDICRQITKTTDLSSSVYSACLNKLEKEKDFCLYPFGDNSGIRPQPDCDQLSAALNQSHLNANYKDCPGSSDDLTITNIGRIISHFQSSEKITTSGVCTVRSSGMTFLFNKTYENDENWKLEACYDDKISGKEICQKTFFGNFNNDPSSYTSVVANILKKTRGIDPSLKCEMIDSNLFNPAILRFRSGCFVVFEKDQCFISDCKHKIYLNDRVIDYIKIKGPINLFYFSENFKDERFSQNNLITKDFKKNARSMNNLNNMLNYFKKSKTKLVHGIGCAEDILPTFFKSQSIGQCSPLPFIINGFIKNENNIVFVTRTAIDSIQAPRLITWSNLFSGVKSYQRKHPLKTWTMYGLD